MTFIHAQCILTEEHDLPETDRCNRHSVTNNTVSYGTAIHRQDCMMCSVQSSDKMRFGMKLTGRLGGRADMNRFAPAEALVVGPRPLALALAPVLPIQHA